MSVRLDELTWVEVAEIIEQPNILILPVGSTEQHAYHLPLNADSCIVTYLSERAAGEMNDRYAVRTLVAPTMNYTYVDDFKKFPGTIGLSIDTTTKVIEEIVCGLLTTGFTNILVINGHGPNALLIPPALKKVNLEYPDAGLYALSWWSLGREVVPKVMKSKMCLHAEEMETSICMVAEPDKVKIEKATSEYPSYSLSEKWATPDFYGAGKYLLYHSRRKYPQMGKSPGVMGDATQANRETGERIIEAVVNDLVQLMQEIIKSEGKSYRGEK